MNFVTVAFTKKGVELALRLAGFLDCEVFAPERFSDCRVKSFDGSIIEWTGKFFHEASALIFVGACGIAVRAISPYVNNKIHDPAVIVVDELGRFVVPILSGHVGGANELARRVAGILQAVPVITTATDVNGLVAVDQWAVQNDCVIDNPGNIKKVSGSLLEGNDVGVAVTCENVPTPFPVTLWLRPKVLVLGAGCNRGVDPAEFERSAMDFLKGAGVSLLSLKALASIDLKKDEPALKIFAERHEVQFVTFKASELQSIQGNFTASETVMKFTGTDDVCERACVLAAGEGSVLLRSKCVYNGVTFALARSEFGECNKSM